MRMSYSKAGFGVVDYCVFITTFVISLGIGITSAFKKKNNSPEDFLLGGRSLRTIPVALSLLTTFISALNIIGYAGEIYAYGSQIIMEMVGGILGISLAMVLTMPVIFPLKLTSINEYIELRFKSRVLCLCAMVLLVLQLHIFMGVVLYASSIALAAVTPISYVNNIVIMGVICTAYSTLGGIRAVVWTDVFQFTVMVIGLCIVVVVGTMEMGGISKVYSLAKEGGRLQLFNMNPSVYERHTFFNTITLGFFFHAQLYGISQINVQRICAVPSIKEARKVMVYNIIGKSFLHGIMFAAAVVAYAAYAGCDPISEGKIQRKEEILSYYIVDKLGYLTGLSGIFVACLTASTLSTFSSAVNSVAALIWKDFLIKLKIFANALPSTTTFINKLISCVVGLLFIGMAFITSEASNMIQFVLTTTGLVYGAIYGVFLLGICVPICTVKGAWSGFIVSCVLMTWTYSGALLYGKPSVHLPYSTEFCVNDANETSTQNDSISDMKLLINAEITNAPAGMDDLSPVNNFPLMYLYGISYTLYPMISPLVCLFVGTVVSYATGPLKPEEVELHLISPILRKFYAKRSQRCQYTNDIMNLTEVKAANEANLSSGKQ